jgi:hypothetical protein
MNMAEIPDFPPPRENRVMASTAHAQRFATPRRAAPIETAEPAAPIQEDKA